MNAYYLQTEQMTVGYHGKPLIEKINLCLRRGEIMTLIGPNGSGKSTILKSIVRQLRLLGGVVRLEQVSLEELSPQAVARKMSVLMTDRLQPELMTCREVAAAGRYPYTGKLGLLTQRDWEKSMRHWPWSTGLRWRIRPLLPSAMGSGSGSCWPGHCARSLRFWCWMSRPLFWISDTSWRF